MTWVESYDDTRLAAKLTDFWAVFSPLLVVASLLPYPIQVTFLVAGLFAVKKSGDPAKDALKERMPTETMNWLLTRTSRPRTPPAESKSESKSEDPEVSSQ